MLVTHYLHFARFHRAHSRSPIEAGRLPFAQNLVKLSRSLNRLSRKIGSISSFQLLTDATKLTYTLCNSVNAKMLEPEIRCKTVGRFSLLERA